MAPPTYAVGHTRTAKCPEPWLVCSAPRSPLPLVQFLPAQGSRDFYPPSKTPHRYRSRLRDASRPNQAIDGKRTSTFLDLQPCRPPAQELHPLKSSAFHGAMLGQPSRWPCADAQLRRSLRDQRTRSSTRRQVLPSPISIRSPSSLKGRGWWVSVKSGAKLPST